jgi:hypothetical protein
VYERRGQLIEIDVSGEDDDVRYASLREALAARAL